MGKNKGSKWVHRLSEVDLVKRTAVCSACGRVKVARKGKAKSGRPRLRCQVASNRNDNKRKNTHFGYLPPENQRCEICDSPNNLRYDHNHVTGKFRGWLCNGCNYYLLSTIERNGVEKIRKALDYITSRT